MFYLRFIEHLSLTTCRSSDVTAMVTVRTGNGVDSVPHPGRCRSHAFRARCDGPAAYLPRATAAGRRFWCGSRASYAGARRLDDGSHRRGGVRLPGPALRKPWRQWCDCGIAMIRVGEPTAILCDGYGPRSRHYRRASAGRPVEANGPHGQASSTRTYSLFL